MAAHMEIAKPSIADAIEQCSAAGYKRVVVAPYFLSSGRHIQQDIPALVAEALEAHPDVECSVADPIGGHCPLTTRYIRTLVTRVLG